MSERLSNTTIPVNAGLARGVDVLTSLGRKRTSLMSYIIQWTQIRSVRDDEVTEEDTCFFTGLKGPLVQKWEAQEWKAAVFKREEATRAVLNFLAPNGDDEWNTYTIKKSQSPPTVRVLTDNGRLILKPRTFKRK